MPDIGKIKYALFRQVKLDGANIKLNSRDKRNKGKEHKIGYN